MISGAKVSGTVKKFVDHGVIVAINEKVKGLIPHLFLTDVPIKNPQLKYNIGNLKLILSINEQTLILAKYIFRRQVEMSCP